MGIKNKQFLKRFKLPLPGGTVGKYGTALKIGMALPPGPTQQASALDPDVLGARGSAKMMGRSVDQAKDKNMLAATEEADRQKAEAAAAAAAAEKPFDEAKESQRKALLRKGRRASILTSSQGASDPLGIPG